MLEHMPQLAFVPVDKLFIHEWHDDQRTPPLIERILASGVFRNPPIVSPVSDGSGRYMVLDGANRTTALRHMGYPHALVQVVHPDDPGLKLMNWNHVVWGLEPQAFLDGMQDLPDSHRSEAAGGIAMRGLSLRARRSGAAARGGRPGWRRRVQPGLPAAHAGGR